MTFEINTLYDNELYGCAVRLVGKVLQQQPDAEKAVVAIDVSGAFPLFDLEKRLSAISYILSRFPTVKTVQVVTFDHEIESNRIFENGKVDATVPPRGRGGTLPACVFALFATHAENPAFFFITDGWFHEHLDFESYNVGWLFSEKVPGPGGIVEFCIEIS